MHQPIRIAVAGLGQVIRAGMQSVVRPEPLGVFSHNPIGTKSGAQPASSIDLTVALM